MSIPETSFKLKLPFPCKFITTEIDDTIFISAISTLQNNSIPSNNITTTNNSITIQLKKSTNQKPKFRQIQNIYIFAVTQDDNNNKPSLYTQNGLQENNQNQYQYILFTDNKKLLKKKISDLQGSNYQFIQINDCQYVIPMQNKICIHGTYNSSSYLISKFAPTLSIPHSINLHHKYIQYIAKLNHHSLISTFTTQPSQDDTPPNCITCFDFQTGTPHWTHHCPNHTTLFNNIIPIRNTCFTAALIHNTTQTTLHLFDIRTNSIVSVLDSSTDQFGPQTWYPHFDMLYKISQYELVTFWGAIAERIGHIVKLDIRFPMRKDIIRASVEHFRYFCKGKNRRNQSDWIICNRYEKFCYQYSVLSQIL